MTGAVTVRIAMASDGAGVLPALVALRSLATSRGASSRLEVFVLAAGLPPDRRALLEAASCDGLSVTVVEADPASVRGLHRPGNDRIRSASEVALFKFFLPDLLPDCGKVLWLDCDILVKDDLSLLFAVPLDGCVAAVVKDSGLIYRKPDGPIATADYFNTGVMLFDLEAMRSGGFTRRLVEWKKNVAADSLMDQNAFNAVLAGRIKPLHPRWNCLFVNLLRSYANGSWTMDAFNAFFGTRYQTLEDFVSDAAILHFASKFKPWLYSDAPMREEWMAVFGESLAAGRIPVPEDVCGMKWTRFPWRGAGGRKAG